jgi:putative oxidoreductase
MFTKTENLEAPRNGALWVVQILGAVLFFISGSAKLSGDEEIIQTCAAAGIGQWFRYATGIIDVASAILFLIPALAGMGALLVVPMMMGAIVTHVVTTDGKPALPIALLIIASIVVLGRKETPLR